MLHELPEPVVPRPGAAEDPQYRQRSPAPCKRPVEKKLYLTFVLSDGDSIPILLTRQWYRWDDPARGKVPFGWEHQPLLADLAPVVFEYYYQTMTDKDRLICGPSGAGYTHPGEMPNLDWFIGQTREYLRRTDLHCVGVCADWDEPAARAIVGGVPEAIGFFHGWGEEPNRKMLLVQGKPYFPYWLCLDQPERSPNKTKDAAYFAQEAAKLRRIVERSGAALLRGGPFELLLEHAQRRAEAAGRPWQGNSVRGASSPTSSSRRGRLLRRPDRAGARRKSSAHARHEHVAGAAPDKHPLLGHHLPHPTGDAWGRNG